MSVAIEFPGTPRTANATGNNVVVTATLPTPAAGVMCYLDGFIISVEVAAAVTGAIVNVTGTAGGNFSFSAIANTTQQSYMTYTFPQGWPASAAATPISLQVGAVGTIVWVVLFGHEVPV